MRFVITFFLAISLVFCSYPAIYALNPANLPVVQGEGAYLIDVHSGQTIFTKNPDKPLGPASTTKIMTGLLAIERGNLNDTVTASPTMLNNKIVYGTQIYLEPGEEMSLQDLLHATLLNSANDAAVAIAEHVGNDLAHFVEMMNQRAHEIGANQTHFSNPSGLTEKGHVTTARDLALIARVAYQNPIFAQYVRTQTKTISRAKENVPYVMVNQNKLLWRDSAIDGIKLGYTSAAQNCLVASASKDGRQLIGVILKSPGREIYTDMQDLFDYGFNQFESKVYKPKGAIISSIMVNNESVDLILDRPIYITQKLGEQEKPLEFRVSLLNSSVFSSVDENQVVAQVQVLDGITQLDTYPLKTSRSVQPEIVNQSQNQNFPSLTFWFIGTFVIGGIFLLFVSKRRNSSRY